MKDSRMPRIVVAALLAVSTCAAHAQVYKCKQASSFVFTDKPCPDSGKAMVVAGESPNGQIQFDVVTKHYEVSGRDASAVHRSFKANNPGGFAGWARWKVDYEISRATHGDQCSVSAVSIRMVGDIMMPRWVEEASVPDIQRYWWQQMYSGLKRHEEGHIQNGREFAVLLKQRLLGLGTVPCSELDANARREYELLATNLRDRDREYDRRTQHGLRQDNPE
jgi:predicted secreted Zn-dependent protease